MCDSPRDKTLGLFYKPFKRGQQQANEGGFLNMLTLVLGFIIISRNQHLTRS